MAFQFKRDRSQNLQLILAGDIDLEVTPDIKTQLMSQLEDANGLTIDGRNISYLDSSGVSILIISMQTCKQKQLVFQIEAMSEEAFSVIQLAKLDKILPITSVPGPAQLVDVDAFSGVSGSDNELANEISGTAAKDQPAPDPTDAMMGGSDDDLIAALAKGTLTDEAESEDAMSANPNEAPSEIELEMTPDPEPSTELMAEPEPEPASNPTPTPQPATQPSQNQEPSNDTSTGAKTGGNFKPGTFS